MDITPLENRVLVRPEKDKEETTPGGLYKPQTVEGNARKGTVLAVGPGQMLATGAGLQLKENSLKKGDKVLFRRGAGLDIDGRLLLDEFEILAKVS